MSNQKSEDESTEHFIASRSEIQVPEGVGLTIQRQWRREEGVTYVCDCGKIAKVQTKAYDPPITVMQLLAYHFDDSKASIIKYYCDECYEKPGALADREIV